jgi:2-polyprenyl-3-methyl-5-hydroxy-6-metoxy-1,4-benzoquinol methylase
MMSRVLGGGPDGANVEYLQTAAESIAAADNSYDIVSCLVHISMLKLLNVPECVEDKSNT